jgi:hypothetical protein
MLPKLKAIFKSKKLRQRIWPSPLWKRLLMVILAGLLLFTAGSYVIAEWYIQSNKNKVLSLGTTFIPEYAESFGLDPHQTLNAIFGDLGMRQVRLVSYWSDIEANKGTYDFSQLDWQMAMANQYGAKVSLAIGLRQPRWPECHEPSWLDIKNTPTSQWYPELNNYIAAVVDRYRDNPAIGSYQLENEYFMSVFGECKDFSRQRLVNEFNLVKQHDPKHFVIISRSDNWIGLPLGQPRPDEFGISVYKRVWDATFTHRYFEYPLPTKFYAMLAGAGKILTGKDMIIHEMQAEPWTPPGMDIHNAPLSEQFKSMNAERMKGRIAYSEATGMKTIDFWGAEWWYWLKVKQNDPSVWNVVKDAVSQAKANNHQILERQADSKP